MKHGVTRKVFFPDLRFKTAILLYDPYISNKHAFDGMIIKLWTTFFRHYDVCLTCSYTYVENVWILTTLHLICRHIEIS